MPLLNDKKWIFWGVNLLIALLIFFGLGWLALKQLDRYTRHGYFILVPDLKGFTPEEALQFTEEKGLKTIVRDSVYDQEALPGTIVEQFPAAGSKVKHNRAIQLIINANAPEEVVFPSLRNAPFRQTLQRLEELGLQPGNILFIPSPFKNLVLDFRHQGEPIEPGSLVRKGEEIDILMGDGNSLSEIPVPDLSGKTIHQAREYLLQLFLNLGEIMPDSTIRNETDKSTALIYLQHPDPLPENRILPGSHISVYISKDPDKRSRLDSLAIQELQQVLMEKTDSVPETEIITFDEEL